MRKMRAQKDSTKNLQRSEWSKITKLILVEIGTQDITGIPNKNLTILQSKEEQGKGQLVQTPIR